MDKNRKIFITLMIVILSIIIVISGIIIVYTLTKNNNKDNNKNKTNEIIINPGDNNENDLLSESAEGAMGSFNSMFDIYEGTEVSASQASSLILAIKDNNEIRADEHTVSLDEEGIVDIEELDTEKTYTISFEYDEEGYIVEAKIEETNEDNFTAEYTESDLEKLIFNAKFTHYEGEITGEQLKKMLEDFDKSNENNPEHVLELYSNNLENLDDIREYYVYEITLGYDNTQGYVESINIDFVGFEVDGEVYYVEKDESSEDGGILINGEHYGSLEEAVNILMEGE